MITGVIQVLKHFLEKTVLKMQNKGFYEIIFYEL